MANVVWPAAWVLLAGCIGDGRPGDCSRDLTVVVGTGATGFTELADGDRLSMVHGPQGGWHVDVSAAVTNSAQDVSVEAAVYVVDLDMQIAGAGQQVFVSLVDYDDAACTGEVWGVQANIDDVEPINLQRICGLHRLEADLSLTVSNFDTNNVATNTVRVFLEASPPDLAACDI